jgi:hypothetical protein
MHHARLAGASGELAPPCVDVWLEDEEKHVGFGGQVTLIQKWFFGIVFVLLSTAGAAYADNAWLCDEAVAKKQWDNALSACTSAAHANSAGAQSHLGVMYDRGLGVAQDRVQAVRWYTLAAQQGEPVAQFNLALMYSSGRGDYHLSDPG